MLTVYGIYAYGQNDSGRYVVYTIDPYTQRWNPIEEFDSESDARKYVIRKNSNYEEWMR